jgi:ABC-type multidrug transport system ATPase subunit
VFEDFDHAFEAGSTLLLGPNGAGKSTLLGLAASVYAPQQGVVALGEIVASGRSLGAYRRRVAWMPQQIRPIPGLSVREQVSYVGWLKGMDSRSASRQALSALEDVGLEAHAGRRPRDLSGGELRRLGLAQTLVHGADFVLMDEPTAGLDPAQRSGFQQLVGELRSRASIVISTHQTDDIDLSYDRVVVIGAGTIRFNGSTADFLALGGSETGHRRVVDAYERALNNLGGEE